MYTSELQDVFNCVSKSILADAFKELGEELEMAAAVIKELNIEIDTINNKINFGMWFAQRQSNQIAWRI